MLPLSEGVGDRGGEAPIRGLGRRKTREEEVARSKWAACRMVELYGIVCTVHQRSPVCCGILGLVCCSS